MIRYNTKHANILRRYTDYIPIHTSNQPEIVKIVHLAEGGRPVRDKGGLRLGDAVGKGEAELGGEKLLDVWAADIISLCNLDDTEDLYIMNTRISKP